MLKVGLIGVGGISSAHIPAWKNIEETSLVAICDIRPEQMEKYEDIHKYTDFDEMLRSEELDILDICLPTYLHADFAIKAMEKGINVICEKPISLKKEDVKRIYETARKNNVKFMVAQVLRFWDEYEFLKKLNDTQKYGKLISGYMNRLSAMPNWSWDGWMQDEKRSGFVPYDLHIHDLDFLVYAFGKPTAAVSKRAKRQDQDSISVVYSFNDAFITCEATWYAGKIPFDAGFRFQFEDAVVINNSNGLNVYLKDGTSLSINGNNSEKSDTLDLPQTNAYENEIRYFTDCVLNDKKTDKIDPQELETVIDILNNL